MTETLEPMSRPLLVPVEGPMPAATGQLGIGRTSVYERVKTGELAAVKIGRRTLITQASIDAFVDRLIGAGDPIAS